MISLEKLMFTNAAMALRCGCPSGLVPNESPKKSVMECTKACRARYFRLWVITTWRDGSLRASSRKSFAFSLMQLPQHVGGHNQFICEGKVKE